MGRPNNGKNGGVNGVTATRNVGLRPTKAGSSKGTITPNGNAGGAAKNISDRSQLNFPYDIRLSGFSSLFNAVTKGTPKVKRILSEECDYIMECRVCRNLFRSVPNFITHKQNYCKKAFDSTWSIGLSNLIQTGDGSYNIQFEVDPELLVADNIDFTSVNDHPSPSTNGTNVLPSSSLPGLPFSNSKSVSDFYTELAMRSQISTNVPIEAPSLCPQNSPGCNLVLGNKLCSSLNEKIHLQIKPLVSGPEGSIVLQQRVSCDSTNCDVTSAHINPLEVIHRDTAILGPDGKVMCTGTSKGIEAVVSRLTAQMNALEKSRNVQTNSSTSITCEICKTVFDTDKALRQHKRESLDCSRIWGFKSPSKENSTIMRTSPESCKRQKMSETDSVREKAIDSSSDSPSKPQVPARLAKFSSPTSARRNSTKKILSTAKAKRALSMSPVKKLKMKYSRCSANDESLSCSRCLSSFTTKHEMSSHLALCTGTINYATLRRSSEPQEEKIRISIKHEFGKDSCSPNSSDTKRKDSNYIEDLGESHKRSSTAFDPRSASFTYRQGIRPKSDSSRGSTTSVPTEVNNNKQYKNGYLLPSSNSRKFDEITSITQEDIHQINVDDDASIKNINSVPPNSTVALAIKKKDKNMPTNTTTSGMKKGVSVFGTISRSPRKGKPTKMVIFGEVSSRLEKSIERVGKPHKVFNLRKAITSRIRKSRRINRPSVRVSAQ